MVEATGRESIGQTDFAPSFDGYRDFPFVGSALDPNDLQALRRYSEGYEYDGAGNMLSLTHDYGSRWIRDFTYEEESQLETGKYNNRLSSSSVGGSTADYSYSVNGSMIEMPHLGSMDWSFKEELVSADLGGGGTAYYVYDGSGQRVRKVIESSSDVRRKERIYVGGFEVWREYESDGETVSLERETLHVMDDKQRIVLVETLTIEDSSAIATPESVVRYQLGNHLGSASVELDSDAALITYEEYHPYGTSSFQAGRSAAEVTLKRYRYTTKERDDETGCSYHGARYYVGWIARWLTGDPIGIADGPLRAV